MKKISIRELNQNVSKMLQQLPVHVTKNGKIVATIYEGEVANVATKESVNTPDQAVTPFFDEVPPLRKPLAVNFNPQPKTNLKGKALK